MVMEMRVGELRRLIREAMVSELGSWHVCEDSA